MIKFYYERMIVYQKFCLALFAITCLAGCKVLDSNSSKYSFSDGYYKRRLNKNKPAKYYVVTGSDTIKMYPGSISSQLADTVKSINILFPPHTKPSAFSDYSFKSGCF